MTTKENLKETASLSKHFVEQEYEYAKLKFFYQVVSVSSNVVKATVQGLFALIALLFVSIGVALWIGDILENLILGFLLVGLFFILITSIVFLLRKKIEKYILTKMAAKYF